MILTYSYRSFLPNYKAPHENLRWEKNTDKFISQMNASVSAPDRALLQSHPEVANMFVDDWREAFRSGIGSTHQESALYTRPWGFRLQDITAVVHLWHWNYS